jgi:hypothetical protein
MSAMLHNIEHLAAPLQQGTPMLQRRFAIQGFWKIPTATLILLCLPTAAYEAAHTWLHNRASSVFENTLGVRKQINSLQAVACHGSQWLVAERCGSIEDTLRVGCRLRHGGARCLVCAAGVRMGGPATLRRGFQEVLSRHPVHLRALFERLALTQHGYQAVLSGGDGAVSGPAEPCCAGKNKCSSCPMRGPIPR